MKATLRTVVAGALAFSAVCAQATVINWSYDTVLSGQTDTPVGPAPWATLVISDVSANTVDFVLTNTSVFFYPSAPTLNTQFLTALQLNLVPGLDPADLVLTNIHNTVDFSNQTNGPGGSFDLAVSGPTKNSGRLTPGEFAEWTLSETGLSANSFLADSSGPNGGLLTLLHIQGIPGTSNEGSTWVTVPEPATLGCMIVGLAALLGKKRSLKKAK